MYPNVLPSNSQARWGASLHQQPFQVIWRRWMKSVAVRSSAVILSVWVRKQSPKYPRELGSHNHYDFTTKVSKTLLRGTNHHYFRK